jgi:hypothetical protein
VITISNKNKRRFEWLKKKRRKYQQDNQKRIPKRCGTGSGRATIASIGLLGSCSNGEGTTKTATQTITTTKTITSSGATDTATITVTTTPKQLNKI